MADSTASSREAGSSVLAALRPALARAAQGVYDSWEQDENGEDAKLGPGGICQDIADAMAGVLSAADIECVAASATVGEQHVFVIARLEDGLYEVDIHPGVYETGGGYVWRKIHGVTIEGSDVIIKRISARAEDFEQYSEG